MVPGGMLILFALLPLIWLPPHKGAGIYPFLVCFTIAGLIYVVVLLRLRLDTPRFSTIWVIAIALRLIMLSTPVALSTDVYRYIWDGHILNQGKNPYAHPVDSSVLDPYDTPLRARVNYAYMATPYLPAAQGYFAAVDRIAPQSPFAHQFAASALDLLTGLMLLLALRRFSIPDKALLIYLWNPLVVVEFAHGAHVDALMMFLTAAAVWALASNRLGTRFFSALLLAAASLVKGWPLLLSPVFSRRWGWPLSLLFAAAVFVPLALFASDAGWGLTGPADGTGVFGAIRIYAEEWEFNAGLYYWLARLLSPEVARLLGLVLPALLALAIGLRFWLDRSEAAVSVLRMVRLASLPFALYLLLSHTIHPWYLALMICLLPFFWPSPGEDPSVSRWIWPWIYYMFFAAYTYISYTAVVAPGGLPLIQTAAYLPFWLLVIWALKPWFFQNRSSYRSFA
jgi:alpha-1,6-mannosyltransferase